MSKGWGQFLELAGIDSLSSTAQKEPNPATKYLSGLESEPFPRWTFRWATALANIFNEVLWEIYHARISDPQKLWDNKCVLF